MPFYEYQCNDCAHRIEVLQKISDDPLVYCPECNKASLKKLISAAAFRLKGTGWYETDFKNNDKKKEKSSGKTSGSNKAAASTSGDSKSGDAKSSDAGTSNSGSSSKSESGGTSSANTGTSSSVA